ncbi:MAG: hypothetical protein Q4G13_05525 [Moraxella sp.]|nr:hypothetical protein [Moraxella sp.]
MQIEATFWQVGSSWYLCRDDNDVKQLTDDGSHTPVRLNPNQNVILMHHGYITLADHTHKLVECAKIHLYTKFPVCLGVLIGLPSGSIYNPVPDGKTAWIFFSDPLT